MNIVQWNMRGYAANYVNMRHLLFESQAACICLQETWIGDRNPTVPRGFQMYSKGGPVGGRPQGGVSLLIRNDIPRDEVVIRSNLQVVAVRVKLLKLYTVCSIYLPPNDPVSFEDLSEVIDQLPQPFIIMGDFNARHTIWGDNNINVKGRMIERVLLELPIIILNDNRPTHFHIQTDSLSNIDLTLCSPEVGPDFEWQVSCDLYGSDHFPVRLFCNQRQPRLTAPRFIYERANWTTFRNMTTPEVDIESFATVDEALQYFNDMVNIAATTSIPRSSGGSMVRCVPWWNEEVKQAIRERKAATRRYYRTRNIHDRIEYKRVRAKTRYIILQAKRNSWKQYVMSIDNRTPIKNIYNKVKKISGKFNSPPAPLLLHNNQIVSDSSEIANIFGNSLSRISEGSSNPQFIRRKRAVEVQNLNFYTEVIESYNEDLSMAELKDALNKSRNSAPGEDAVSYQMLKQLPESALDFILQLFNRIWREESFPGGWRKAVVLPFAKEGKDGKNVQNYRPIALTSSLCKLMEKIVNNRLMWTLESRNILSNEQYGFRRNRSTTEVLVKLDTAIKKAFANKQHVIAIFFDIKKAYDTTWKRGILNAMFDAGLRGHMPIFIRNFLRDRVMKVRINDEMSDEYEQIEGVPQGSVLSVTCFALAINGLPGVVPNNLDCTLYVDDFALYGISANLPSLVRRMQLALNRVVKWSENNGFTFSEEKTVVMRFSKIRNILPEPELTMYGRTLDVVNQCKFLGLTLDNKLTYIPHIKRLKQNCTRTLNVMKSLSGTEWGADREPLLMIYRSLIRSKLDYASQIYSSATKTALKMLDSVHHAGIRLSIGAFRSSPVESLYVESTEPSLYLRRNKISLQLYMRILAMEGTPAYESVADTSMDDRYDRNPRLHTDFGYRMRRLLNELQMAEPDIAQNSDYRVPYWKTHNVNTCLNPINCTKAETPPNILRAMHLSHCRERHANELHVYTDGSKSAEAVTAAVVLPNATISRRLPNESSIFTAELNAILMSLSQCEGTGNRYTIFTDSRSTLQAISDLRPQHHTARSIRIVLNTMETNDEPVSLCWVPSHVGVEGNERADAAARSATTQAINNLQLPYRDYYPIINKLLKIRWTNNWSTMVNNKLYELKRDIQQWQTASSGRRRRDTTIARLRIGHTRMTHGFLMDGSPPVFCDDCIVPLTVKHVLIECPEYADQRARYLGAGRDLRMDRILGDDPAAIDNVVEFVRAIGKLNEI